jgi:enamine deaminase RidA (YjgF/YER057c/UK114 family)
LTFSQADFEVQRMRMLRVALLFSCVAAVGLSAQMGGKQFVRPAAGQNPPYSPAIKAGGFVYVSGTLPSDVKGDITAQTRSVFDNLRTVLGKAGTSLDNAASVTVMLKNASDFPAMDAVYKTEFKGEPPARTTVMGDMVLPGALLEVEVTAVANGGPRKAILPEGWMKPTSPYNYAIQSGDTVFLSGLVSRNGKDNSVVQGDMATQVKTCMDNAAAILKAAGLSLNDIVSSRVALRDVAQFDDMNKAYRAFWEKDRPTRATMQTGLPGSYGVEITFVAVSGPHEVVVPPTADGRPGTVGPNYSPAIKVGNRMWISGMSGATADNQGDMKAQTTRTFEGLGRALKAGGFDYKDVIESNVWIRSVSQFNDMNAGYRPVFPTDPPVRSTIGVGALVSPNALVEIALTAEK